MSEQEKNELVDLQGMEISPLSDSDLDSVAGGARAIDGSCSCCETVSGCTSGSALE
jgi:hypothetical protein